MAGRAHQFPKPISKDYRGGNFEIRYDGPSPMTPVIPAAVTLHLSLRRRGCVQTAPSGSA